MMLTANNNPDHTLRSELIFSNIKLGACRGVTSKAHFPSNMKLVPLAAHKVTRSAFKVALFVPSAGL
jgi:hypothetical protein